MRWYQNPLLQFAVIGLLLFGFWHWQNGDTTSDAIIISAAQIEQLADSYERAFLRQPKPDELQQLINDEIRNELAFREAERLGLDKNDTIIKRRMRQKIEFLAQELSAAESIDDAELARFYETKKGQYQRQAELDFVQIFIDPKRHSQSVETRIDSVIQAIADGADPVSLGDPLLLPMSQKRAPVSKIESTFGKQFAQSLLASDNTTWFGPVESAFGLHLVRINARHEARIPELMEVSDQVRKELIASKRVLAMDALYSRLREKYSV
ncbi:MAG: peptidylprolyl isomerase, partial [Pseudomonadota bacterium]